MGTRLQKLWLFHNSNLPTLTLISRSSQERTIQTTIDRSSCTISLFMHPLPIFLYGSHGIPCRLFNLLIHRW